MSECVVRMEMPKKCYQCDIRLRCSPFLTKAGQTKPMCEGCRIICQLPEGHGRLVDADAAVNDIKHEILEYKMEGMKGTPMPTEHLWLAKNWIADEDICPTIVPAERSET